MTEALRLVGHADVVGSRLGFLVPVFQRNGSNALHVQIVGSDGSIAAFAEMDGVETPLIWDGHALLEVGDPSIWSFMLGDDDIVEGPFDDFRIQLRRRLEEGDLQRHPMLAFEVAGFVGDTARRLELARLIHDRTTIRSASAAATWCDLCVLTPDLRGRSGVAGLVATVDGPEVSVRGPVQDRDGLEGVVRGVLRDLSSFYPEPPSGWRIAFIPSGPTPRPIVPDALVQLTSSADHGFGSLFEAYSSSRVRVYGPEEPEQFDAALRETGAPGFCFVRDARVQIEVDADVHARMSIVRFGTMTAIRDGTFERKLWTKGPTELVCVAAGGGDEIRTLSQFSTLAALAVDTVMAIERHRSGGSASGRFALLKIAGRGEAAAMDALATLYDRIHSCRLSTKGAFVFRSTMGDAGSFEASTFELLFPEASLVDDIAPSRTLRRSRTPLAALVSLETSAGREHQAVVPAVLRSQGWRVEDDGTVAEVAGTTVPGFVGVRRFSWNRDDGPRPRWKPEDLLNIDLRELQGVAVTSAAVPEAVVARLVERNELSVDMRDMFAAASSWGLWSIVAALTRRFASTKSSRARSCFLALVLRQAFRDRDVDFHDAGLLFDALRSRDMGRSLRLSWVLTNAFGSATTATVRLQAGRGNSELPVGTDLMAPFEIVVAEGGVEVRASS